MDVLSFFVKAYITYYSFSKYGVIIGLVLCYILFHMLRFFMKVAFKLERVNNIDIYFIGKTNREKFNLMGAFFFEDFDEKKIKQLIIERGLSKLKKFRMRLIYKYFGYYWKEVSLEESIKRIKIVENHKINSDDDMMNYIENEVNNHIDIMNEMPFEFHLIKYADNSGRGSLVIKLDHTMSDGLGAISATLFMADNYSPEIFPPIMRKGPELPWYQFIIDIILFPYYGVIVFYQMILSPSPMTPFREGNPTCGRTNIILSKTFNLKKFVDIRKKLNITFNDLIMCVVSKAINRLINKTDHKGYYKHLKNIKLAMPIGRKTVPNNSDEVKINNEVNVIYYKLPLIEDIHSDYKTVVKTTSKYLKNPSFFTAAITLGRLFAEYMPNKMIYFISELFMNNVDLLISNVPGPTSPLFYAGSKLTKLFAVSSNCRSRAFIPILSYNNSFHLLLSVDSVSGINKNEVMKCIEEELHALTSN